MMLPQSQGQLLLCPWLSVNEPALTRSTDGVSQGAMPQQAPHPLSSSAGPYVAFVSEQQNMTTTKQEGAAALKLSFSKPQHDFLR